MLVLAMFQAQSEDDGAVAALLYRIRTQSARVIKRGKKENKSLYRISLQNLLLFCLDNGMQLRNGLRTGSPLCMYHIPNCQDGLTLPMPIVVVIIVVGLPREDHDVVALSHQSDQAGGRRMPIAVTPAILGYKKEGKIEKTSDTLGRTDV